MYVSYTAQDNKSNNDQSTAQVDTTEGNYTINDLILTSATLTSILTPRTANNFTVGFQYWNNLIDSHTRTPYFLFPDGVSFGTNINVPQKSSQHKFQFRDDFSHSLAKHTLRMGVDFVYEPEVGGFFENNPTPEFDFFATASTMLTNKTLYPTGFSSPGAIQASTGTSGNPAFDLAPTMLGFYFEDDWRASPRLLLNLGLRYDREIGTYGIDKQANSRTHQEIVAASKVNVPTVPTTQTLPPTGVGYPTYYIENRLARPQMGMAHAVSLIAEGVFEKFPRLKVLINECDQFWAVGLMWHMDADWKSLREQTPWLKRLPSEYFVEHIRVPPSPETLRRVASTTGGRFFSAASAQALRAVYVELGRRIGHTTKKREIGPCFRKNGSNE